MISTRLIRMSVRSLPGPYDIRTSCYHNHVGRHAIVLLALVATATATAAPQVDIRARTRLAVTRVKVYDADQVDVTGQLVDKLTGEGIGGQTVVVTVGASNEAALTQADGTFHAILAAPLGPMHVDVAFAGNRVLDAADRLGVDTDPAKQQIEIAITKQADDPLGARLYIVARDDNGPIDVPIVLSIAPQGTDDFRGLPGTVAANHYLLTRKDAGGPGMYRLRAAFVGDDRMQAASREVLVELTAQTSMTIAAAKVSLAFEDDLVVAGAVVDDDARPVTQCAVTLMAGDHRLAQGTTDAKGAYRFKVEAALLGGRDVSIQASADPAKSYVKPSHSAMVQIHVADPQPVPVSYTVAAFVATGLAAAAFFLARTKPWQRLRKQTPPAEQATDADPNESVANGGLVTARPGIVSTLRRPSDEGFAGVVRDTVRGRPIAGAVVRIALGATTREHITGDDGAFALEGLGAGEWRASVGADGHVTEQFAVTIPHRGELRGVRVDLVPVRERVFQLYRRAAEPILPESRLWGVWSPRQIVDHVRTKRPTPALSELTDFVEEVYFGPRLAAEAVLAVAAERVDRAIHERANPR
jgi:hypothetical protein